MIRRIGIESVWGCMIVAMLALALATPDVVQACPTCVPAKGECNLCGDLRAAVLGLRPTLVNGPDVPDPAMVGLAHEPITIERAAGKIALKWGDIILCFKSECRTGWGEITPGTAKETGVSPKIRLNWTSNTQWVLRGADGKPYGDKSSPVKVYGPNGELLLEGSASGDGSLITMGPEQQIRDEEGGDIRVRVIRGTTLTKITYIKYVYDGAALERVRVTQITYNSDDTVRALHTIYGYYTSGSYDGHLKYVVEPEGVWRYLKANATTVDVSVANLPTDGDTDDMSNDGPLADCDLDDLDDVSDANLSVYASHIYNSYHVPDPEDQFQGNVTSMTALGGCGGCGGEAGTVTYAYGPNGSYPGSPTDDQKYNTWKTYVRITSPSGQRRVQFFNMYGQKLFDVVQEMTGATIDNSWITHTKYGSSGGSEGEVVERRHPSACTVYSPTASSGWTTAPGETDTGTDGLVQLYEYDANGNLSLEKVREGVTDNNAKEYYVRKYAYSSVTYNGYTTYQVTSEKVYPTETISDTGSYETTYSYTYYDEISGTATGAGAPANKVLQDTGAAWEADSLIGAVLTFTSGPNSGETQVITDNDATSITVGTAFSNSIASGHPYQVLGQTIKTRTITHPAVTTAKNGSYSATAIV